MLSLYPKRRPLYLCSKDTFSIERGSQRVARFGAQSTFRRGCISASRIPDIIGLGYNSRYKTLLGLSGSPDAQIQNENSFEEAAKNHGHRYEQEAAYHFLYKTDLWPLGSSEEQYTHKITIRHTGSGKIFDVVATPDLLVYDKKTQRVYLLEIKCPFKLWCENFCVESEEEEADGVPLDLLKVSYYIQTQFQMIVTGIKKAFICVYFPERAETGKASSAIFEVDEDLEYQRFLLMAVNQALDDMDSKNTKIWQLFKNERPHNHLLTVQSMRSHVTRLEI